MTTPLDHTDDAATGDDSVPVIDLATVIATVDGTIVAGTGPAHGLEAANDDDRVGLTRLCSPSAALAGGAGADAIVVVSAAADLERVADWPLGIEPPGVLVVGRDGGLAASPAGTTVVAVADARLALALLSASFARRQRAAPGAHPAASIDAAASLADGVSVGAGAIVAAGARVGRGTAIGPNCVVGAGASVGAGCVLHANVTLYDGVSVGDRVILHAGVVLGADGFGYAASRRGAVKIHHLGSVRLGDDVEVGANTAIDRGTIDDTVVGHRTKIDNLCQIGHNVVIGSDCLIAGTAAIGGSATIGDGVIVGGNVAIADHVTIGAGARLAGRSGVTKDVPAGETWAGFPARPYRLYVRSLYLSDKLEQMWEYVKKRAQAREP